MQYSSTHPLHENEAKNKIEPCLMLDKYLLTLYSFIFHSLQSAMLTNNPVCTSYDHFKSIKIHYIFTADVAFIESSAKMS